MRPLTLDDVGPLCRFGFEPSVWRWTINKITTQDHMRGMLRVR